MHRTLPNRPSLEQLKKQAKDLRKAHRSSSPEVVERIQSHLPRLSTATPEEIIAGNFSLQEAQHVIACEYGCKHWEMLCSLVTGDLNALAGLSNEHIQTLLREVDQQDFIRAFMGAGYTVSQRFLSVMSQRVRKLVREEMVVQADLAAEEREDSRRTILSLAAEMTARQQIVWPERQSQ